MAPAENACSSPVSTATRSESSASKARNSSCSRCGRLAVHRVAHVALVDPHHHHAVGQLRGRSCEGSGTVSSLPSPPMRVISGSARGRKLVAPGGLDHPTHARPRARGHLQRARQPRRRAGGHRARPVRRERGDGHRGAVARRRPGHLRRPGHRGPPGHRGEPGDLRAHRRRRGGGGAGRAVPRRRRPAAPLGPGAARPALRLRRLARAAARPARAAPRCSRARRPSTRRSGGRSCGPSATAAPTW